MMDKQYYVYILTNKAHRVLYTGVTNNLIRRMAEHKNKINKDCFTARYNVNKLVYYEAGGEILPAIEREKQIKAGSRAKKLALINSMNPEWHDLAVDFYD